MKRFLVWLCTIAMLMSSIMLTPIAYAADTPTATATDVYISGDWVVGGTLTANYTYYDPAGSEEDTANTLFAWYRSNNSSNKDEAISGATGKTYTLTASDVGKHIFCNIIPNGSGKGLKVTAPGYGPVKATDTAATAPVSLSASLVLTGGASTVKPGTTLRASYAAAFYGKGAGTPTVEWYTSSVGKTNPVKIENASSETYTVTEADYGKYIYATVTAKDADGNAASTAVQTAAVKVGAKMVIDRGSVGSTLSPVYTNNSDINKVCSRLMGTETAKTYGNRTVTYSFDAGEQVNFDGFYLYLAYGNKNTCTISYSEDNTNWTDVSVDGIATAQAEKEISMSEVKTARYFQISFNAVQNINGIGFYPYLSAENRACEMVDIISADNGITFDNTANTVTGILYGMPANVLKNSIHALDGSTVSIADASGADIADLSGIKITDATSADYRVKIARDNATHLFTLACAPAYKTDDFSTMTDSRKYWGNTWGTRNFAGTADVQWYGYGSDADSSPYAVKDVTDGVTSAKIVKNGTSGDNTCAVWYGAATNPTDKISFSFDVKMDDYSVVSLAGKIDDRNGKNTFGSKMSVGSGGIVAAGTDGLKKMVNIKPDEWYHVEIITDLENDTHTILVEGVVYAENVPFTYAQANPAKTSIFFNLLFYVTKGGENDINYLKNVQFRKVYSVSDYTSADGEEVGMTLYDGTDVVTALTPGKTYTAKNNGKIFTDNYYVAVYKVNYADAAAHTVSDCVLVDAKQIKGSAAATGSIYIPADIKSTYESGNIKTGAMVKVFYFNDMITPVKKPDVIR